jgi:hypothetical protein
MLHAIQDAGQARWLAGLAGDMILQGCLQGGPGQPCSG